MAHMTREEAIAEMQRRYAASRPSTAEALERTRAAQAKLNEALQLMSWSGDQALHEWGGNLSRFLLETEERLLANQTVL